jgi:hypothetical protein
MESKCPVCSALLWPQAIEPVSHYECTACPFQCLPADLPRIAAALELARASTRYDDANEETEISDWDALYAARKRAYEVFGGE